MKLKNVKIKNFRSIADVDIDFTVQRAIGLVGVNESGKSNILKALSLLSTDIKPEKTDVRIPRADEPDSDESLVSFFFELSSSEVGELIEKLHDHTVGKEKSLPQFLGSQGIRTFEEFARSRNIGQLEIDLNKERRQIFTSVLSEDFAEVENGWLSLRSVRQNISLSTPWNSSSVVLIEKDLLRLTDFETTPDISGAAPLTPQLLDAIWQDLVREYVYANLPQTMLWTFEKENLLPASVPLSDFINNPELCKPLQSMFELAGIKSISKEISREQERGRHRLNNLLSKVAARTSAHLKLVWSDYNPASIELQLDGDDIRIAIRDESLSFNFDDRSDGFKRFITFLLMVSAKLRRNENKHIVLLIDEPEVSLHPAGIRNLRDELLRLAERNTVVFSTHSPYMIDRKCVDRHLIVYKISEVTRCESATAGRVFDEEVLFNSLGASAFEALRPSNIIFEGWRDKRMFNIFLSAINDRAEFELLTSCGTAFSQGVKDIRNIMPILALAHRKAVIVTDSDQIATESQTAFEEARFDGVWKTYNDLLGAGFSVTTAEDFIKPAAIIEATLAVCASEGLAVEINEADFAHCNHLDTVSKKIAALGIDKKRIKSILNHIKSFVFENLRSTDIQVSYEVAMISLNKTLEELVKPEGANVLVLPKAVA